MSRRPPPRHVGLRPVTPEDHEAVLALNERHVELLAPLDHARLEQLLDWCDRAEVVEVDGTFGGFVITFAAGSPYDGENFAWFSQRHEDFAYLDRVVIAEPHQRRGLGTLVYDRLEAECGRPVFALEVNLDPPNEPSLAFHRARGYSQVGQRVAGDHVVALMTKALPD